MSKYVASTSIRGEKIDYTVLVLYHLNRISQLLIDPPQANPNGTVDDFKSELLFNSIRLLDCWLSAYAGGTNYNKQVEKEGYRTLVMASHRDILGQRTLLKKLFAWHDLQVGLFTALGIAPLVKDFTPIDMNIFPDEKEKDVEEVKFGDENEQMPSANSE